ncbi:MAG TPA: D-alanine--D-alanine ligase family protein [Actinomycetota bacterium]|nr:D-alanine--D-alanine ligase family protein [Actinomycetota bacterium]
MSESRIRVGVVYGGTSSEHSISCVSAGSVLRVLDPDRFEVVRIGIDRQGTWRLDDQDVEQLRLGAELPEVLGGPPVELVLHHTRKGFHCGGEYLPIDVAFPILHGPFGEDGTVQGLFEVAGIPYVGSGVLASALCMDKITFKRHLAAEGVDVGEFVSLTANEWHRERSRIEREIAQLGWPVFVKPSRAGSSQGISKVSGLLDLAAAVDEALRHDPRVIVEAGVAAAREVEVGVLATPEPQVSVPGEIVVRSGHDFYDFEAKYLDDSVDLVIDPELPDQMRRTIAATARTAFRVAMCEGLARVDFFVSEDRVILNEVNTMPGFTSASMFPLVWQASGRSYSDVVTSLLDDALRRGVGLR